MSISEGRVARGRSVGRRQAGLGPTLAAALKRIGVEAEVVLVSGVGFALGAAFAFALAGLSEGGARVVWLGFAVISIQMRMACAVLGRLLAEDRAKGPIASIWKTLPDRVADALILIGAGYASLSASDMLSPALAWLSAFLALAASYVRELGRGMGVAIDRVGPGGKGRRMAILTVGALVSMLEWLWGWQGETLLWTLALLAGVGALTVFNRTRVLARGLAARS